MYETKKNIFNISSILITIFQWYWCNYDDNDALETYPEHEVLKISKRCKKNYTLIMLSRNELCYPLYIWSI